MLLRKNLKYTKNVKAQSVSAKSNTLYLIILVVVVLLFLISHSLNAQQLLKRSYTFDAAEPLSRLAGNLISDIVVQGDTLWFGTSHGLSMTFDGGETWQSYSRAQGIGRGGVSAVQANDEMIWVATVYDTLIEGEGSLPTGGGLSYSTDGGASWQWMKQPGVTPVYNITYDIAIQDSTVWIASFGGGLQKSDDMGLNWEVVPPDTFLFDPWGNLNHRVFAVISVGDTLWVGTAGGINKSTDKGETWENFAHRTGDANTISGNFIGAIGYQRLQGKTVIWAATRKAEGEDEVSAISKTENGGATWTTLLENEFCHYFAVNDNEVYTVSDNGLFKSIDGENFYNIAEIVDTFTGERAYTSEFYSVTVDNQKTLWIGTADGLAKSTDNGYTWSLFRAFKPTGQEGTPRTYAYPNPFSPLRHNQYDQDGFVRLQYNTKTTTTVTIKIYDFALDLVTTLVDGKERSMGDFSDVWNGKNEEGEMVANGVYFYSVEIDGDGTYWGKIMVLN